MARKSKVKVQYILDRTKRMAALRRGQAALMKKVAELEAHHSVKGLVIVYPPGGVSPTVFPPDPEEARRLCTSFLGVPEEEEIETMMRNHLMDEIAKAQEKLLNQKRENCEETLKILWEDAVRGNFSSWDELDEGTVDQLLGFIDEKLKMEDDGNDDGDGTDGYVSDDGGDGDGIGK